MKWVFWASRVFTPMRILLGLNKIEKDRLKPKGTEWNRTGSNRNYIYFVNSAVSIILSLSQLARLLSLSQPLHHSLSQCPLPPLLSLSLSLAYFQIFSEWQFTLAWPGTFASAEWLVQHPSLMEKPMMHCIRQVCQFTSYSLVCYY